MDIFILVYQGNIVEKSNYFDIGTIISQNPKCIDSVFPDLDSNKKLSVNGLGIFCQNNFKNKWKMKIGFTYDLGK